ncbi:MAG: Rnf-Nqr domain containing protein [Acutalibacteraceae bacterium]
MTQFFSMLITALYAMLLQNLVFSAAYGITESIKIAKKPKYLLTCTVNVAFFSTATSVICRLLENINVLSSLSTALHFLLYTAVLAVLYLITGAFCVTVLKADKKYMNSLGMCAINSLVLSVPLLNASANYDIFEAVGTGIGAALAFILAVLLINAGIRHIANNENIPVVFRGTPALLIYVSLLSLACSCFTGESLFL